MTDAMRQKENPLRTERDSKARDIRTPSTREHGSTCALLERRQELAEGQVPLVDPGPVPLREAGGDALDLFEGDRVELVLRLLGGGCTKTKSTLREEGGDVKKKARRQRVAAEAMGEQQMIQQATHTHWHTVPVASLRVKPMAVRSFPEGVDGFSSCLVRYPSELSSKDIVRPSGQDAFCQNTARLHKIPSAGDRVSFISNPLWSN